MGPRFLKLGINNTKHNCTVKYKLKLGTVKYKLRLGTTLSLIGSRKPRKLMI